MMRKSNFALRLQPSVLEEARKLAESEGVGLTNSSTWRLPRSSRRSELRTISTDVLQVRMSRGR